MSFPRATSPSRRAFLQGLAGTALATAVGGGILDAVTASSDAVAATPLLAPPERMLLRTDGTWTVLPPSTPRPVSLRTMFLRAYAPHVRRTVHVSGAGTWSGDGSRTRPFREISQAIAQAQPGDLVSVGDGVYSYTQVIGFQGRPDAWLTIATATEATQAVITVPPPCDNFVNVIGSSYVALYGFEIRGDLANPNTNGSGLSVYGNSHHVVAWCNTIHDFPGGGINCFDVEGSHDVCEFAFNRIYRTSRYSPANTSGISLFGSSDLTGGGTWPGGHGYRIVGNYVYDVLCTVPYTPGGMDVVTDGNGVSVDCLQTTHGYTKPVLITGNIITGCGGRAVHVYNSVNVVATTNVAVGNLRTDSPAITGGVDLDGTTDGSVQYVDNVVWPGAPDNPFVDATSTYRRNVFLTTAGHGGPVRPRGGVMRLASQQFRTAAVRAIVVAGGDVTAFRPLS